MSRCDCSVFRGVVQVGSQCLDSGIKVGLRFDGAAFERRGFEVELEEEPIDSRRGDGGLGGQSGSYYHIRVRIVMVAMRRYGMVGGPFTKHGRRRNCLRYFSRTAVFLTNFKQLFNPFRGSKNLFLTDAYVIIAICMPNFSPIRPGC